MTVEATLSRQPGDPGHRAGQPLHHNVVGTSSIPVEVYRPIAEAPPETGSIGPSRKIKRLTETREIRIRTTHRRRKYVARGGVLAGFGIAMVIYPLMGTVVEYHNSVAAVPGVVLGETPTTGRALLGDGPTLIPTIMEVPSADDEAKAIAASNPHYILSNALPNCVIPASFEGVNGQLAEDQLCTLWGAFRLRADAAVAFAAMNEQFSAKYGRNICIQEGYRSYADQIAMKAKRGYLAASPGTSMHGFGLAFDLCDGEYSGDVYNWIKTNAATFGYVNPNWAKASKYEPWHWEYAYGVQATGHYGNNAWFDTTVPGGAALAAELALITPTGSPEPTPSAEPTTPAPSTAATTPPATAGAVAP